MGKRKLKAIELFEKQDLYDELTLIEQRINLPDGLKTVKREMRSLIITIGKKSENENRMF